MIYIHYTYCILVIYSFIYLFITFVASYRYHTLHSYPVSYMTHTLVSCPGIMPLLKSCDTCMIAPSLSIRGAKHVHTRSRLHAGRARKPASRRGYCFTYRIGQVGRCRSSRGYCTGFMLVSYWYHTGIMPVSCPVLRSVLFPCPVSCKEREQAHAKHKE